MADVLYWIKSEPRFGQQAVYLDDIDPTVNPPLPRLSLAELKQLKRQGVQIIAPPIPALLAVDDATARSCPRSTRRTSGHRLRHHHVVLRARGPAQGRRDRRVLLHVRPDQPGVKKDSDMYKALDVLAARIGVLGVFSDWPATVTYYASCMGLK